jgi:hypothetical protein
MAFKAVRNSSTRWPRSIACVCGTFLALIAGMDAGGQPQTPAILPPSLNTPPPYVAMCLSVKDQHDDILEWVQHYEALGVERAYVYDHGSSVPMSGVLGTDIARGQVAYEYLGNETDFGGQRPQLWIYDRCLRMHGPEHAWLAFFDADEFLVLSGAHADRTLPDFLHDYAAFGGLGVNWR